jgi:hypothetical protein
MFIPSERGIGGGVGKLRNPYWHTELILFHIYIT